MSYKNLEYIESTGTQYIDTEFVPDSNTTVEMQIAFTEAGITHALFCARSAPQDNTFTCFNLVNVGLRFDYYQTYSNSINYIPAVSEVVKVRIEKNKAYVNDVLKYTHTEVSFTAGANMYLLASYILNGSEYGTVNNFAKAKLYYCKIYDGDTLVRDFVPALDIESGKAGLYDNVNNKFYSSKQDDFKYIVDYTSIDDIVAGVDHAIQLRTNAKNDDGTDTITGVDWFSYGGTVCSNVYASGNSWIGFGSSSEHLKVNRRDAAMWNLWREEGTYSTLLNKYRFLRIRWSGYESYNQTDAKYLMTYDVVLFETGDIMLYMVDIPTPNYSGVFTLGSLSYTKPTANSRYVTFYLQEDGSYVAVNAPIDLSSKKYLVRDGSTLYTVTDGKLAEVTGELSADLFMSSGVDTIPDGALLLTLTAPEVLCWTDGEKLPALTATVQGVPEGSHDIVSDNIRVGHSSIYGITSVEATASEGATFLLSFDGGAWMVYDTDNSAWVASDVGMTATELVAIPADAWNSAINSAQYMQLKATLDGVDTVTQVKFNFNNESPTNTASESEG